MKRGEGQAVDRGKRKLLYLKPAHSEAVLYQDICAAGWDVRTAEHHDDAIRLIASRQFHVGLALFNAADDWALLDGTLAKTGPSMEWIAMVAPASMRLAAVSRRIHANFFDYHTLPADSQRLLLALGHAYGMAILASSLMLTPWQAAKHRPVLSLDEARRVAEQAAIERALRRTHNNMTKAARELGISRVTLYRLLEKSRVAGSG